MDTNGSGLGQSRTSHRFQDMDAPAQAKELRQRWQLAQKQVDSLLESIERGEIEPTSVYPLVPYSIIETVSSLFGFAPRGGLIETELLSRHETFVGAALTPAGAFASRS